MQSNIFPIIYTMGIRSVNTSFSYQIREIVVVVTVAQLAVSLQTRHGKRELGASLSNNALPRSRGRGRVGGSTRDQRSWEEIWRDSLAKQFEHFDSDFSALVARLNYSSVARLQFCAWNPGGPLCPHKLATHTIVCGVLLQLRALV